MPSDTLHLSALYRYPIKSTAGESLDRAVVGEEGIAGDRRFMLARPDGVFLTARSHPQLVTIRAELSDTGVVLHHPALEPLALEFDSFEKEPFTTQVWNDSFRALTTTLEADCWCEQALGEPARFLWLGERSPRYSQAIGKRLSFADGFPLMLIGEASLEDLNQRASGAHVMAQFRPNLVMSGGLPFAEDKWHLLRIGETELAVRKPCTRCAMITVDPDTGTFIDKREPLRTLADYRRGLTGQVEFGQNLVVLTGGELEVGMPIEVLG
ncbi:MOSC domain-containing protein [Halomonas sp. M20]|uniref:MOSC domain-containing protein n=1 Tax=Halomonas sp. M20 TaxID=2763264 RepID=UPI001D09D593|nr:MOSC N-terminal beta barrel domain-containing protein [Halomonas sp. M20]